MVWTFQFPLRAAGRPTERSEASAMRNVLKFAGQVRWKRGGIGTTARPDANLGVGRFWARRSRETRMRGRGWLRTRCNRGWYFGMRNGACCRLHTTCLLIKSFSLTTLTILVVLFYIPYLCRALAMKGTCLCIEMQHDIIANRTKYFYRMAWVWVSYFYESPRTDCLLACGGKSFRFYNSLVLVSVKLGQFSVSK